MFFDFFEKKETDIKDEKEEIIKDMIVCINNANDYINQNIRTLKYTFDLFYGEKSKKKQAIKQPEENEQMYMFAFDSEDQEKMDDMINDFIEHLRKKDPDINIEILDNEDMGEEDE